MKFYHSTKFIFLIGCLLLLVANTNAQCDIKPDVCLEDGDVYLEDPCRGVVLTSPTGDCYRLTVNSNGELETNLISCIPCSEVGSAPSFVQSLADLSVSGNANCESSISVPFQIDYSIPIHLSVSATVIGPDASDASLTVDQTASNGTISDYALSGSMPVGTHTVTILVEDSNCNFSSTESFDVTVTSPTLTQPTFECKKIVKAIEDAPTIPSVTFTSDEIVCVTDGISCDSIPPTLISSFSNDPNDTVRTYDCNDIGDQQVTMFIFDVLDSDGDGVLDTIFREPCFAIQTVVDQSGFCQF